MEGPTFSIFVGPGSMIPFPPPPPRPRPRRRLKRVLDLSHRKRGVPFKKKKKVLKKKNSNSGEKERLQGWKSSKIEKRSRPSPACLLVSAGAGRWAQI